MKTKPLEDMGKSQKDTGTNEKISMALIGTGSMGRKYARMIDSGEVPHMNLAAVCCRKDEACRWATEYLHPGISIYRSAEELYQHPKEYDGVLIVTPHSSHALLASQAFALGKHVFCDKPSGISLLEAQKMNQAARKSGKQFAMMFHQRLYKKNQRIYEIINSGKLGKILRVSMENTEPYRTAAYHNSSQWRSTWAGEGGGALINQGQHLLDLWQWLFGMPKEVRANISFGKYNDFSVDDEAVIWMKYDNGITGSFFLSTGEAPKEERLKVIGSKAALFMNQEALTLCQYSEDSLEYGKQAKCRTREAMEFKEEVEVWPTKKDYGQMLENFALAVLAGEPLYVPGEEGRKAIELANAAYLSAWTGESVSLPLDAKKYEEELRKRIQQERSWSALSVSQVSNHRLFRVTTLCYLEQEESYLMLHRISKEADENKDKWIGVGGHAKEGESPEECLLREVKEETGLTLTSYRFRGLITFVSDQWGCEYMCLYTADGWTGEMTLCDEGTLEWVKKDHIGNLNIWEGDKIFFKLLEEDRPFFSLKLRYEGECLAEAVLDGIARQEDTPFL